jgi:hypothetical protein
MRLRAALATAVIVPLACTRGSTSEPHENAFLSSSSQVPPRASPAAPCVARLRRIFVEGDLSGGEGLSPGCRRIDVEEALGPASELGVGSLSYRYLRRANYRLPGQPHPVEVWYEGDDPSSPVVLADQWRPQLRGDLSALLQALGEPDGELPPAGPDARVQRVYAARGFTLYVGEFGQPRVADEPVVRLRVYAPTTVAAYMKELGGGDAPSSPFPR